MRARGLQLVCSHHPGLSTQAVCRGSGIHLLPERNKLHPLRVRRIDETQQVLEVTVQVVKAPHHKHIIRLQMLSQALQLGMVPEGHGIRAGIR